MGFAGPPAEHTAAAAEAVGAEKTTAAPETHPAIRECAACHRDAVLEYLGHGMARSIGPRGTVATGAIEDRQLGRRYRLAGGREQTILTITRQGGGVLRQRIVGRIGGGNFATSWAGEALHPLTGQPTGRLYFAPLESTAGGLHIAPFALYSDDRSIGLPLTGNCLGCHTLTPLATLPGAARRRDDHPDETAGAAIFPAHQLGGDAFTHLKPIGCAGCHGDTRAHLDALTAGPPAGDIAIARLATLPPGAQRDRCARCHLQGDARLDLVQGRVDHDRPLAGQIPVLVPVRQKEDDFRFVGQLERLALSACFRATGAMTCTTCHRPHRAVRAQGLDDFNAVCKTCHDPGPAHTSLSIEAATGRTARSQAGCVDCHMRQSQPFDLPYIQSADHFIRRHLTPPQREPTHRAFAEPEGELQIFDDGRLSGALASEAGQRWQNAVLALGEVVRGRFQAAQSKFDRLPAPGSEAARNDPLPHELAAILTQPAWHQSRALTLMVNGRLTEARAAFDDALTLDPLDPDALLGRARLSLDHLDLATLMQDTQALIDHYPKAEQPWDLRLTLAERLGRPDLARAALEQTTALWPHNAQNWYKLGMFYRQAGQSEAATRALEAARRLEPGLTADHADRVE